MFSELDQPRKSVQFNEAVQVKTVEEPQEVEINEEKIDRWAERDRNDSLQICDVLVVSVHHSYVGHGHWH